MRQRRFSQQQLFHLRNHIPIDALMEQSLQIPCKTCEGVFRFLCPVCNAFNTSIKPQTNLARCFRCERNFNTIDLVMTVKKTTFVEAVDFLIDWQSHCQPQKLRGGIKKQEPGHNERSCSTSSYSPNSQPPTLDAPVALGQILRDVINTSDPTASYQKQPSTLYEDSPIIHRLEQIELRLTTVCDQLGQIRNQLYNQNRKST